MKLYKIKKFLDRKEGINKLENQKKNFLVIYERYIFKY